MAKRKRNREVEGFAEYYQVIWLRISAAKRPEDRIWIIEKPYLIGADHLNGAVREARRVRFGEPVPRKHSAKCKFPSPVTVVWLEGKIDGDYWRCDIRRIPRPAIPPKLPKYVEPTLDDIVYL